MAHKPASLLFGGLYGYTKQEKKQSSDLWKFIGITAPLSSFWAVGNLIADTPRPNGYNIFGALIIGPIAVGWYTCIGNEIGKATRKALNDS